MNKATRLNIYNTMLEAFKKPNREAHSTTGFCSYLRYTFDLNFYQDEPSFMRLLPELFAQKPKVCELIHWWPILRDFLDAIENGIVDTKRINAIKRAIKLCNEATD